MEKLNPKRTIKDEIEHFIFNWHEFSFDYWWRKKYNIPFGSQRHREMNFIDMAVEYREEMLLKEMADKEDIKDEEAVDRQFGLNEGKKEVIKMTKEEVDDEYENLDLSQFDKK